MLTSPTVLIQQACAAEPKQAPLSGSTPKPIAEDVPGEPLHEHAEAEYHHISREYRN